MSHAAVGGERGDEGDVEAVAREAFGKLKGRVDVALSTECYQKYTAALGSGVLVRLHIGRWWLDMEIGR